MWAAVLANSFVPNRWEFFWTNLRPVEMYPCRFFVSSWWNCQTFPCKNTLLHTNSQNSPAATLLRSRWKICIKNWITLLNWWIKQIIPYSWDWHWIILSFTHWIISFENFVMCCTLNFHNLNIFDCHWTQHCTEIIKYRTKTRNVSSSIFCSTER